MPFLDYIIERNRTRTKLIRKKTFLEQYSLELNAARTRYNFFRDLKQESITQYRFWYRHEDNWKKQRRLVGTILVEDEMANFSRRLDFKSALKYATERRSSLEDEITALIKTMDRQASIVQRLHQKETELK